MNGCEMFWHACNVIAVACLSLAAILFLLVPVLHVLAARERRRKNIKDLKRKGIIR